MAHRKKTLRQMPPNTRKIARLIDEADSAIRRLKKILPELQTLELLAKGEQKRNEAKKNGHKITPDFYDIRTYSKRNKNITVDDLV